MAVKKHLTLRLMSKGLTLKQITGQKYSLSYHLILPMMPGHKFQYMPKQIINVYCKHKNDFCIAILYRKTDDPKFKDMVAAFHLFRTFQEVLDINDTTLVKFAIPGVYEDDIFLILDGKYSKVSSLLKSRIRKFHDLVIESPLCSILYKYPERRRYLEDKLGVELGNDSELFEMFNLKENTYE